MKNTKLVWLPVTVFLLAWFVTLLTIPALSAGEGQVVLTDIQNHWAREYIGKLVGYGILSGYPDHTFRPNDPVTRAEFVKMAVMAELTNPDDLDSNIKTEDLPYYMPVPFSDTGSHWSYKQGYLQQALDWGFINPDDYPSGLFEPDRKITRLEMAVILVRTIAREGEALLAKNADLGFTDKDEIPSDLRGYVKVAAEKELISGYPDGTFQPSRTATRAEAAKMITKRFDATYTLACYTHHKGGVKLAPPKNPAQAPSQPAQGVQSSLTGNLSVTVLAAKTPSPAATARIAGARVQLDPGGFTATATSRGEASFEKIPVGAYRMRVEADGYEPYNEDVKVPVLGKGLNNTQVFLFPAPQGEPVAGLEVLGDGGAVPYNTPVSLSAYSSQNASRHGFRWEIRDAAGKLLTDPYAKTAAPLQLAASTLPGDDPYTFTFTPPSPGKYTLRLYLTNPVYPGKASTAEVTVQAVNVAPEAVASVVPGPAPLQKQPAAGTSLTSGLGVIPAGETVYLRGWGIDANVSSPELYNPGGNEPDMYGKNHDHYQRQFRWRWSLSYALAGTGAWEDVSSLLKSAGGDTPGTAVQYPLFKAEKPGRYRATLVVEDGSLASVPASVDILVLSGGLVAEAACQGCHADKLKGWQWTSHGRTATYATGEKAAAAPHCQSCHGPGKEHLAASTGQKKETIGLTYRSGLCGQCHQEYGQWQKSRHSDGDSYGYQEIIPALLLNCTGCHYAKGHAQRAELAAAKGKEFHEVNFSPLDRDKMPARDEEGISCATCHDPHPDRPGATLRDGTPGETCNTCHYEKWQNAILKGMAGEFRNGYEYPGENYQFANPHLTEKKCVTCHMDTSNRAVDARGIRLVGDHTLRMRDAGPNGVLGGYGPRADNPDLLRNPGEKDDVLNLAPCQKCHTGIDTFDLNGAQRRIYEKWVLLGHLLKERNNGVLPGFKPGDKCATCHRGGTLPFDDDPDLVLENAYINYKLVKNDRSWGIHNVKYVDKLLDDSIRSVREQYKPTR
ncbi:hypothetical protein SY88_08655 [Clostridiales bacterium PH28_bin88]|nr:hypothetical protein SY88_08655 [Clostridiales bacterium PH28_bin88]